MTTELEIDSVAVGGDGVARDEDGRVVFVPRTAPGDRVRADVTLERSSFARARVHEILRSGPGRRQAPCRYYSECGGCQVQHLEVTAQLEAKRRAVGDALERIGGLSVEVPPLITAGPALGYRNRITLTLRREGSGRGDGSGIVAGYHRHDAPGELVDVEECPLAEEPIDDAWRALRAAWGPGASVLPAGSELRVTLRASSRERIALFIEGGDRAEAGDPARVASAVEALECYAWRPEEAPVRTLAGAATLRESWLGIDFELPPEVFLQANRSVAAAMEDHLDERLDALPGAWGDRSLLDLYAGVGARPIRWARRGAGAGACELDDEAVECGRRAAASEGASVDFRAGRVEERLAELAPATATVVNPPRAGLSRRVSELLCDEDVGRIAYVSCDPATLARDLARLTPAFRVASVQPFDAFPQTAHVETIAWLVPR